MNILIALLVLGLIIFIHELGHFLMAKLFKMPVEEFAIGMGPTVYSYTTAKTKYSIRAIPVGGFVSIEGMELDSDVEDGFNTKPPLARFLVLIAGVMMNFILAFVILFTTFYTNGAQEIDNSPVINHVFPEMKASKYLKKNDEILKINNISIKNWDEIGKTLKKLDVKEVNLEIKRSNEIKDLVVPLTKIDGQDRYMLGITPNIIQKKLGILESTKFAFTTGINIFNDTISGLKKLVTGQVKAKELAGPIGIIKIVGDASQHQDTLMILWLMALISINIGVLNLLPFPALDGGRIIFVILETFGIKINKKFEEKVHTIGIVVLFALIFYITGNDIMRIMK